MKEYIEYYIDFCKKFTKIKIPKLKFKDLSNHYKAFYKKKFLIEEDSINKATFCIFIVSFALIWSISLIFIKINILIIIFYSLMLGLLICYEFNLILYKKTKTEERIINSKLYFIRIDYNLINNSSNIHSDFYIQFIKLMINYNISISKDFENMLFKIHCGKSPQNLLKNYITPSKDFNDYLERLIMNNFNIIEPLEKKRINSLEDSFKIHLKEITTKLSIIFFIGIFFPIGLCFFLFLLPFDHILILLFIPLFLLLLNFVFNKFINKDHFLIGITNQNSKFEAEKLNQFLLLIEKFAINLENNYSPEKAFLDAFFEEKKDLTILLSLLEKDINLFLNGIQNFKIMLNNFKRKLVSIRYELVIQTIINMMRENAQLSSNRIIRIIEILKNHQKLHNKLMILIKGERFKTFVYLFLLPIIIGSVGALSPFLSRLINIIISLDNPEMISFHLNLNLMIDIFIIYLTLLFTNSISSYFFLSVIYFQNKTLLITISDIIFSFVYFLFLTNFLLASI